MSQCMPVCCILTYIGVGALNIAALSGGLVAIVVVLILLVAIFLLVVTITKKRKSKGNLIRAYNTCDCMHHILHL